MRRRLLLPPPTALPACEYDVDGASEHGRQLVFGDKLVDLDMNIGQRINGNNIQTHKDRPHIDLNRQRTNLVLRAFVVTALAENFRSNLIVKAHQKRRLASLVGTHTRTRTHTTHRTRTRARTRALI